MARKASHKRKQRRQANAIRKKLDLPKVVEPASSPIVRTVSTISQIPKLAWMSIISLFFSLELALLFCCESIGSITKALFLPLVHLVGYYVSICSHSLYNYLHTNEDPVALAHGDLFERMKKLENSLTALQKKHIKLQYKLQLQEELLKTKKFKFEQRVPKQRNKQTLEKPNVVTVLPPVVSVPPPPAPIAPPPPPPPMMGMPKLRKLVIPKRKEESKASAAPSGITLENVLGIKGRLKKVDRRAPKADIPKSGFGISLSDINSIQLRRSNFPKPKVNAVSPKSSLPQSVFRLRNTGVQRSPGGTPMKENIVVNENSPANILSNALMKKFKHTRSPGPSGSSPLPPSPYESPQNIKPLSVRNL